MPDWYGSFELKYPVYPLLPPSMHEQQSVPADYATLKTPEEYLRVYNQRIEVRAQGFVAVIARALTSAFTGQPVPVTLEMNVDEAREIMPNINNILNKKGWKAEIKMTETDSGQYRPMTRVLVAPLKAFTSQEHNV